MRCDLLSLKELEVLLLLEVSRLVRLVRLGVLRLVELVRLGVLRLAVLLRSVEVLVLELQLMEESPLLVEPQALAERLLELLQAMELLEQAMPLGPVLLVAGKLVGPSKAVLLVAGKLVGPYKAVPLVLPQELVLVGRPLELRQEAGQLKALVASSYMNLYLAKELVH